MTGNFDSKVAAMTKGNLFFTLPGLPGELIQNITECLDFNTKRALRKASKTFHRFTTEIPAVIQLRKSLFRKIQKMSTFVYHHQTLLDETRKVAFIVPLAGNVLGNPMVKIPSKKIPETAVFLSCIKIEAQFVKSGAFGYITHGSDHKMSSVAATFFSRNLTALQVESIEEVIRFANFKLGKKTWWKYTELYN